MLSSVIKLCCKHPAAGKLGQREHFRVGNSKWTWGISWGWMGHTEWDSVLLSALSPVSVLVWSCYEFSSVLSHQREIRVNSPFTFVYEETPLHCQLRPPPLLTTHPHSGRKQGQNGCHVWGSSNMADPWSTRTKSPQESTGYKNLEQKTACVRNTDSDIVCQEVVSGSLKAAIPKSGVSDWEILWSILAGMEYSTFQILTEANQVISITWKPT